MKYLMIVLSLMFFATSTDAKMVSGYTKKNGTHVTPSYRTKADSTRYNNYSTKGNTNPYSGKKGYKPTVKPFKAKKMKF